MPIIFNSSIEDQFGGGGSITFQSFSNSGPSIYNSSLSLNLPRSYRSPNTNLTFANGFACAAHVYFTTSSGVPTVVKGMNVSTVSDLGVGEWEMNFWNNLPSTARGAGGHHSANAAASGTFSHVRGITPYALDYKFAFQTWTNRLVDPPFTSIVIYTT